MDYLQQIKEEFSDLKPHSGDLNWDNEAYTHFKKKNYIMAEKIFKKVCISEPEHHSGPEGLAYVYYAEGEFDRAEWFMEEALKRARIFEKEDAIDLEVIEEMEKNYTYMQQRELLDVAGEDVSPGELMKLFSKDQEAWFENVYAATMERSFKMVMEALEQPLPFELLDRDDVDSIEEISQEDRLLNYLFDYYQELLRMKEMDKCRELLEKYRSCQPDLYRKKYFYFDKHLIQQALFRGDKERVKDYLNFFIDDPVEGIDELVVVVQLLLYYGLTEEAEEISRSVYRKVEYSPEIVPGGADEFVDVIFLNTLEQLYHCLQKGEHPAREDVDESLREYETSVDEEMFDDILLQLSPGHNRQKIENLLVNKAGLSMSKVISLLLWQFCKYMLEHKEMHFATTAEMFHSFVKMFKDKKDSNKDFTVNFFALPREEFRDYLMNLGGLLSNQWPKTGALLWFAPYVYDFFLRYGLIEEKYFQDALEIIAELKKDFIQDCADRLWQYSFVLMWPVADSVDELEKTAEREKFEKSFREVREKQKDRAGIPPASGENGVSLSSNNGLSSSDLGNILQLDSNKMPINEKDRAAIEKKHKKKKAAKKQRQKQRQKKKKRKR